jgi:ribosomal protein L24E
VYKKMPKCTFCGKDEKMHKGVHLIKNDGEVSYFCGSKCNANAVKLGRDKRKIRWAEAFHITRAKSETRAKEVSEKEKELKASK